MCSRWKVYLWPILAALMQEGCINSPNTPGGTGAEQAVSNFYDALIQQDWSRAYRALDSGSRSRHSPEEFGYKAASYRRGLGFEPATIRIRSCEEHGAEAVAHVIISGPGPRHSFRDGAQLRREAGGWGVVLSPGFGKTRSAPDR